MNHHKEQEIVIVQQSNIIVNPQAMMIKTIYTAITSGTVLRTGRFRVLPDLEKGIEYTWQVEQILEG